MKTYKDLIKQLRESSNIRLIDFKELSYEELDKLSEAIKYWHTYGNGDAQKLGKINESKEI